MATIVQFDYTGAVQSYTVPSGIDYIMALTFGASGGYGQPLNGGGGGTPGGGGNAWMRE